MICTGRAPAAEPEGCPGPFSRVRRRRSRCPAAAARATGTSRPTPGCSRPAIPARRGRPAGSPPPRSPGPGRRACGGARRIRPVRSRPARRTACGRSRRTTAVSPSGPGSSGNAHRIGWVTEKTQRAARPQDAVHLAHDRAVSATNGSAAVRRAGQVEGLVRERQRAGVGLDERETAAAVVDAPRVLQLPVGEVQRDRACAPRGEPARALRRARADLQHRSPLQLLDRARAARRPPRPGPPGPRRSGRRPGTRRVRLWYSSALPSHQSRLARLLSAVSASRRVASGSGCPGAWIIGAGRRTLCSDLWLREVAAACNVQCRYGSFVPGVLFAH